MAGQSRGCSNQPFTKLKRTGLRAEATITMPNGSNGRVGSRVLKGGPSKLRGVIWHKSNGKWEARIYEAGKQRFLGYFTSEVSAAKAYDARAVQLHGAGAKVNFPEDHYETRNNPPAVKPYSALSVPTPAKEDEAPHGRSRPAPWSSSASKRATKRKGENQDEDYVLPGQSRARRPNPQYSLRQTSSRKITQEIHNASDDSDSEESLEKGAVEVLATLLSSSDQDGSWRSSTGSGMKWGMFGDAHRISRASSPPTASTGASPAPAPKQRVWTPPLFVQQGDADSADFATRPQGTLQACARARLNSLQEAEEFAESHFPGGHPMQKDFSESSSDSEQLSANLPIGSDAEGMLQEANDDPADATPTHAKTGLEKRLSSSASAWTGMRNPVAIGQHSVSFANANRNTNGGSIDRAFSTAASSLPAWGQEQVSSYKGSENVTHQFASSRAGLGIGIGSRPSRGSSRFRGVSWCEKGQKWRALLWDGNRQHFLGHFKSEEDGARAYDRALLERKKKDGCLNFPLSDYQDSTQQGCAVEERRTSQGLQGSGSALQNQGQPGGSYEGYEAKLCHHLGSLNQGPPTLPLKEGPQNVKAARETATEQNQNSPLSQDALNFSPVSRKWKPQICWGAQIYRLGSFEDKEAAAQAYEEAVALGCKGFAVKNPLPAKSDISTGETGVQRQVQEVQEGSRAASDQAGLQRGQYSDFLKYVANRGSAYKVFNETPSRPRADGPSIRDVARPGPYTNASWRSGEALPFVRNDHSVPALNGWGQKKRRCLSP